MASLGHVAVGMLLGRMHGGAQDGSPSDRRPWGPLAFFGALAALPDLDVVPLALGLPDVGLFGHRGVSHSLAAAIVCGFLAAHLARRWRWPWSRTLFAATAAVSSHACLDVLGGGRGLLLFWPLSAEPQTCPWHLLREAPRGLALFCHRGVLNVLRETALFSPLFIGALLPRRARAPASLSLGSKLAELPRGVGQRPPGA